MTADGGAHAVTGARKQQHLGQPTQGHEGTSFLKTLTSLNKEVRPFSLSDNSIWSFPSVSSLSDHSIWRS